MKASETAFGVSIEPFSCQIIHLAPLKSIFWYFSKVTSGHVVIFFQVSGREGRLSVVKFSSESKSKEKILQNMYY